MKHHSDLLVLACREATGDLGILAIARWATDVRDRSRHE